MAANGGSDLIYVPDKDLATVKEIVNFLSKQDYTSGIFVDDALGSIAGALPLSSINLKGSSQLPTPTIILNFKSFATDLKNPTGSEVEIADTGLQQGQGMHGNFGRGDTFNNMAAIGPDFKRGYADLAPVSNADVATTLAAILGFNIPSNGNLIGRVITEALKGGPDTVPVTTGILKSDAAENGQRTYLNYQQVGDTKYFDAAGFEGRTVGLSTSLQTDANGGQKTFVVSRGDSAIITNFGGIGKGANPSGATLKEADTLKFVGQRLTAQNLLLTQAGADLIVTFEGVDDTKVTLKDFRLEDLDNLLKATGGSVNAGNILFDGQTSIADSFDVFDANSHQRQVFNPNTVTFLNGRNTTVYGFDNSDDVMNAQDGNHKIYGLSGNDILRGGSGNNKLYGGDGYDILVGGSGQTTMTGGRDSDIFVLSPTDGLDKIEDFNPGEGDRIGLVNGFTFDQLSIMQGTGSHKKDTFISLASTGELLAMIKGVQANTLTRSLFTEDFFHEAIYSKNDILFSFAVIGCNREDKADLSPDNPSTANLEQLNRTFQEIAQLSPNPKFLFFAGDLVYGYTPDTTQLENELKAWLEVYNHSPLASSATSDISLLTAIPRISTHHHYP